MTENPILSLVSIDKDGCVRVASRGNISAAEMGQGSRNPLEVVLGENWPSNRVILDLSKTDFIDSTAIAWLIASSRQFRESGGAWAIHSMVPRARQMLDLLKLARIIPVVTDEAAARSLLNGRIQPAQAA